MAGRIYCGDNLEILSLPEFFQPEMVDLIYADPPFNSQRTYNIVYKGSNAQTEAFKDYWTWTEAAPTYAKLLTQIRSEIPARLHANRALRIMGRSVNFFELRLRLDFLVSKLVPP